MKKLESVKNLLVNSVNENVGKKGIGWRGYFERKKVIALMGEV